MNVPSRSRLDEKARTSPCSVETMTVADSLMTWPMPTFERAELVARKLSVAAMDHATYPNPFFVVDSYGKTRSSYFRGTRHVETMAA